MTAHYYKQYFQQFSDMTCLSLIQVLLALRSSSVQEILL